MSWTSTLYSTLSSVNASNKHEKSMAKLHTKEHVASCFEKLSNLLHFTSFLQVCMHQQRLQKEGKFVQNNFHFCIHQIKQKSGNQRKKNAMEEKLKCNITLKKGSHAINLTLHLFIISFTNISNGTVSLTFIYWRRREKKYELSTFQKNRSDRLRRRARVSTYPLTKCNICISILATFVRVTKWIGFVST